MNGQSVLTSELNPTTATREPSGSFSRNDATASLEPADAVFLLHAAAVIDHQDDRRGDLLPRPGRLELEDLDVLPLLGHAELVAGGVEQERAIGPADLELDRDSRETPAGWPPSPPRCCHSAFGGRLIRWRLVLAGGRRAAHAERSEPTRASATIVKVDSSDAHDVGSVRALEVVACGGRTSQERRASPSPRTPHKAVAAGSELDHEPRIDSTL